MPANTNPIFQADRKSWLALITDTDGTAMVDVVVGGTHGTLIDTMSACSDDTAPAEINLYMTEGATTVQIGSVTVAAGAGTDGGTTASIAALNQTDMPWLRDDLSVVVGAGQTLKAAAFATVGAGKFVSLMAQGGDF